MTIKITVKNMVCDRCIKVVKQLFEQSGLTVQKIELGRIWILEPVSPDQLETIEQSLIENGFEILVDSTAQLIEAMKTNIISLVQSGGLKETHQNISDLLAQITGKDYSTLSQLFSSIEGVTIEKYVIFQKIEKAKELLVYGEMTRTEIAEFLGYSSVQYLSTQFKKVTGLTPKYFQKIKTAQRKSLDQVLENKKEKQS